jgi:hypothetical protein
VTPAAATNLEAAPNITAATSPSVLRFGELRPETSLVMPAENLSQAFARKSNYVDSMVVPGLSTFGRVATDNLDCVIS